MKNIQNQEIFINVAGFQCLDNISNNSVAIIVSTPFIKILLYNAFFQNDIRVHRFFARGDYGKRRFRTLVKRETIDIPDFYIFIVLFGYFFVFLPDHGIDFALIAFHKLH